MRAISFRFCPVAAAPCFSPDVHEPLCCYGRFSPFLFFSDSFPMNPYFCSLPSLCTPCNPVDGSLLFSQPSLGTFFSNECLNRTDFSGSSTAGVYLPCERLTAAPRANLETMVASFPTMMALNLEGSSTASYFLLPPKCTECRLKTSGGNSRFSSCGIHSGLNVNIEKLGMKFNQPMFGLLHRRLVLPKRL